jgi:allantoin racemase
MKIRIIIPITSRNFAIKMSAGYAEIARPDTAISVVCLDKGPASLESQYEDAVAVPQVVLRTVDAEREGADAVIIDCMNDPGLQAAREAVSIPVVGPAQSSMLLASILAHKFSVVSISARDVTPMELLVSRYGLKDKYASTRWVNIPVLDLHADEETLLDSLTAESIRAIREDGAHAIVFGCGGMIGLSGKLEERLKSQGLDAIVIDPSQAALKWAEMLVDLDLAQSRRTYPLLDEEVFSRHTASSADRVLETQGEISASPKLHIIEPVVRGFREENWLEVCLEENREFARKGSSVKISAIQSGPATLETRYAEALAVPEMLRLVRSAEQNGDSAAVIDCMYDPSLDPAREVATIPVVGPSQTSAFLAASLAHRFSYLGTSSDMEQKLTDQAEEYGISSKLASVRTTGLSVEEVETNPEALFKALLREAEKAVLEDNADCLILGCTGMTGIAGKLRKALLDKQIDVPVIEPMAAAFKMAEALSDLGLAQSKLTYPQPPKKTLTGYSDLEI